MPTFSDNAPEKHQARADEQIAEAIRELDGPQPVARALVALAYELRALRYAMTGPGTTRGLDDVWNMLDNIDDRLAAINQNMPPR